MWTPNLRTRPQATTTTNFAVTSAISPGLSPPIWGARILTALALPLNRCRIPWGKWGGESEQGWGHWQTGFLDFQRGKGVGVLSGVFRGGDVEKEPRIRGLGSTPTQVFWKLGWEAIIHLSIHSMITEHLCPRHHAVCKHKAVNKVDLVPALS